MKVFRFALAASLVLSTTVPMTAIAEEHTHDWSEWATTEEPDCDFPGLQERTCSICDEEEQRKLPALAHDWSDWTVEAESSCDEAGWEIRTCSRCDAEETRDLPLGPHDWSSWETLKKATPFKTGKQTRECEECGKTQTKIVAKRALTSNEKKAEGAVSAYLNAVKNTEKSAMAASFASKSKKYGFIGGTSLANYLKKYNKKMVSWTFTDVKTTGKKIKVTAKVNHPNFYKPIYKATTKLYEDAVAWSFYHSDATKSQQNAYMNKLGKSYLKSLGKNISKCKKRSSTDTVTFTMVKSNGKWKIEKRTQSNVDIACGYFHKATEDAGSVYA